MNRLAQVVSAPVDGTPLRLFFQSTEVHVVMTGVDAYFHFVNQPPHGDGLFQLMVRGRVFCGYIWGTSTYWSPNGRYLAAEWSGPSTDKRAHRQLVLIDLIEWRYVECGAFRVERIDDGGLHGKDVGGNSASIRFQRQTSWDSP